jgi:hypothetical protein
MRKTQFKFNVEFSLSGVAVGHGAPNGNTVGISGHSRVQIPLEVVDAAHYNI